VTNGGHPPQVAGPAHVVEPAPVAQSRAQTTPTPGTHAHPDLVRTLYRALSRCRARTPEAQRWRIANAIHRESQRYGYDPLFILALVEVESKCAPAARSRRGALGLIQMKPSTARAIAKAAGLPWRGAQTLTTPALNVQLALRYLSQLEKQFGDLHLAVAAYNLGPQRVVGMPRSRARQLHYVKKVASHYEQLVARHGPGYRGRSLAIAKTG
jgi:soluble lytic murein transglycosylase-like protein